MRGWALLALFWSAAVATDDDLQRQLRKELQPLVDEAASKYGSAYSLGFVARDVALELVAGSIDTADAKEGIPAKVGDAFAWGSVTKTFTGAGIMQRVAAGQLKLSDPAEKYVDPMLRRAQAPYKSMQEFFQADRWGLPPAQEFNASEITVRHLLAMLSGIRDYDTSAFRDFQYTDPSLDFSPLQILDWVHGPLMFKPGGPVSVGGKLGHNSTGMNYCSVNYILLGYILAELSGAQTWVDYDQADVVPANLRKHLGGLSFPKAGSCGRATRVHGYDLFSARAPYDVSNTSCLAGWTAGNIIMPSLAAAEWTRALWGSSYDVVPKDLLKEMVNFTGGSFYGLATMNMTYVTGLSFLGEYGQAVGHLGDTYGFTSMVTYFPKLDVGMAVATNHEDSHQAGPRALVCTAYNRALDIILEQTVRNCTYAVKSYFEDDHHFPNLVSVMG